MVTGRELEAQTRAMRRPRLPAPMMRTGRSSRQVSRGGRHSAGFGVVFGEEEEKDDDDDGLKPYQGRGLEVDSWRLCRSRRGRGCCCCCFCCLLERYVVGLMRVFRGRAREEKHLDSFVHTTAVVVVVMALRSSNEAIPTWE